MSEVRLKIEKVTVTIDRDCALQIINALNKSLDPFDRKPEEKGAGQLLELLNGSFIESHSGVHHSHTSGR